MWLHVDLHTLLVSIVNYLSVISGHVGYFIERRMILGAVIANI